MSRDEIIAYLKAERAAQGVSQAELARRLNWYPQHLQVREADKHDVRLSTLIQWAESLGLTVMIGVDNADDH